MTGPAPGLAEADKVQYEADGDIYETGSCDDGKFVDCTCDKINTCSE